MDAAHFQVLTAAASREEAAALADALLEARLAACVQVVGPVQSRYWWQGRLETAEEWLCLAKTTAALVGRAVGEIEHRHGYDVPEVTVTPIVGGNRAYLRWVEAEATGRGSDDEGGGAGTGSRER